MWPGMAFYLTLFYPPSRTGKRIGRYFTASQVSASVVGLVSAGFQLMDGLGGLVGFQWMFLLYGLVGIIVGISLLWWLPDRPLPPGVERRRDGWRRWIPVSKPALTGEDALIHYRDLRRVYHYRPWTVRDLTNVMLDWRLWPLTVMYFGVVGVGIGVQNYGTVIIAGINPSLTDVQLSLLFAPIWIVRASLIKSPLPFITNVRIIDGSHRHPSRNAHLRPLPPPPCPVLQRPRAASDHWAAPHHVWTHLVVSLRRLTHCRVRPGPHRPTDNGMDVDHFPTAPWRGRRCSSLRAGQWARQSRQHPNDVCVVRWLACRRGARSAPVPRE